MMFAETAPADHSQWLTNLQFFFSVVLSIGAIWALVSNRPQKREVTLMDDAASKKELESIRRDMESLGERISSVDEKLQKQGGDLDRKSEERIKLVHDRVNDILAAVCRMEGKVDLLQAHQLSSQK